MAAADGGAPRLEIRSDRLLLVEGRDEVNLFDALLKHCFGAAGKHIQIVDGGGKDRFPQRILAIRAAAASRSPLLALGVVRDADNNAGGAFQERLLCAASCRLRAPASPWRDFERQSAGGRVHFAERREHGRHRDPVPAFRRWRRGEPMRRGLHRVSQGAGGPAFPERRQDLRPCVSRCRGRPRSARGRRRAAGRVGLQLGCVRGSYRFHPEAALTDSRSAPAAMCRRKLPSVCVRPEAVGDRKVVRRLLLAAFPTSGEASLVERLHGDGDAVLSLVAVEAEAVVGHVLFSRLLRASRRPCPCAACGPRGPAAAGHRREAGRSGTRPGEAGGLAGGRRAGRSGLLPPLRLPAGSGARHGLSLCRPRADGARARSRAV